MTRVRDLMTDQIETVTPDASAQEAAGFMLRADTGSIPVCEDGKLVGIVTDRDLAVRGLAQGLGPDCKVRDLMSDDLITANVDDEVGAVAQRMAEAQVRRLPVLDTGDRLVGMVSLGDLSREAEQAAAAQALEGVSEVSSRHNQG